MTPKELAAVVEAAAWRREQEQQRDLWLAWHVAALTRAKRMPSLKELLGKPKPAGPDELERRRLEHEELIARVKRHGR